MDDFHTFIETSGLTDEWDRAEGLAEAIGAIQQLCAEMRTINISGTAFEALLTFAREHALRAAVHHRLSEEGWREAIAALEAVFAREQERRALPRRAA